MKKLIMKHVVSKKSVWYILFFTLFIRLISLPLYPLMDSTEARYGEIARIMVETGNWLTPQFDYNVPFWGKPPLATWLSAMGIKFLGLSEFALRFPHWLTGVATLLLVAFFAYRTKLDVGLSLCIIATSAVFIIVSGAIMTDMALTFSFTLAMISFYFCWQENNRNYAKLWAYLGFIGLALGLLAKGPIIIVLMGIAVFPFLVVMHGFWNASKVLWQRFPLISASMLMLSIALPWYIMAEQATPGFIDYFIVGEHFNRFIISGWEGDLYGSAHNYPLGKIWYFWISSALPGSLVLLFLFWKKRNTLKQLMKENPLFSFSLFWLLSPLLFFTLSANILPAYILPAIPALGILITLLVNEEDYKWLSPTLCLTPLALILALPVLNLAVADRKSDKILFEKISLKIPIFYYEERPFSGQYYSYGQAKYLEDVTVLTTIPTYYLIGKPRSVETLIKENTLQCTLEFNAPSSRTLYLCNNKTSAQFKNRENYVFSIK